MSKKKIGKRKGALKKLTFCLIALVIISAIVLTVRLVTKDKPDNLALFQTGEFTQLESYKLKKANIDFLKKITLSEDEHLNTNEFFEKQEDEYLLFFYGDKCEETCLNDKLIEKLREVEKEGNIIYGIDTSLISELAFTILTRTTTSPHEASVAYIKNGSNLQTINITNNNLNEIPTKDNNIGLLWESLRDLDSTQRLEKLSTYFDENYPGLDGEEKKRFIDNILLVFKDKYTKK